ncbi:hypothetical protein M2397_003580 [Pseudomonas sp. BIGb0381]|jgi:hypothetical protein|nr:hypothetical protein [Pseudomonas sp. BIGb0381]
MNDIQLKIMLVGAANADCREAVGLLVIAQAWCSQFAPALALTSAATLSAASGVQLYGRLQPMLELHKQLNALPLRIEPVSRWTLIVSQRLIPLIAKALTSEKIFAFLPTPWAFLEGPPCHWFAVVQLIE